jgi:hypothetical protein
MVASARKGAEFGGSFLLGATHLLGLAVPIVFYTPTPY